MVFFLLFFLKKVSVKQYFWRSNKKQMKKILSIALSLGIVSVNAQQIKLEPGKKITSVSTADMDMDMGMGGQIKIKSSTTNVLSITGNDDKNYKGTNTITKMTMSQEGMGQSTEYDSDKKTDRDSDIGKAVGKEIDKSVQILIDKSTGIASELNPEKAVEPGAEPNPMAGIMGGIGEKTSAAMVSSAFFIIPKGKKIGDKWSDSSTEAGMKGVRNYELQSTSKDEATILLKTISKGVISKESQGMQMEMNMTTTAQSIIKTNIITGLVKKNSTSGTVEGTLDLMGQSMPISMKMTSEVIFE